MDRGFEEVEEVAPSAAERADDGEHPLDKALPALALAAEAPLAPEDRGPQLPLGEGVRRGTRGRRLKVKSEGT